MRCPHCEEEFTEKELADFQEEYRLRQEFEVRKKKDIRINGAKAVGLFVLGLILVGAILQGFIWFFKLDSNSFIILLVGFIFLILFFADVGFSIIFHYDKKEEMFRKFKETAI